MYSKRWLNISPTSSRVCDFETAVSGIVLIPFIGSLHNRLIPHAANSMMLTTNPVNLVTTSGVAGMCIGAAVWHLFFEERK
jgi:hypothetical protein